jgi:hypothetical protein
VKVAGKIERVVVEIQRVRSTLKATGNTAGAVTRYHRPRGEIRMKDDMPTSNDETPDETAIWRYMDLPKFVAMLVSKSQWFTKAAHFEDVYEGFCQVLPREMPADDRFAKCITRTTAEGDTAIISLTQAMVELSRMTASYLEHAREHLYVNSWCLADESMAMWEIYGVAGRGIAVRSSVGQYRAAAKFNERESQYDFGKVKVQR